MPANLPLPTHAHAVAGAMQAPASAPARRLPLGEAPVRLGRDAIERLLPHRAPMLLLAEASWVEPGRRGLGRAVDLGAAPRCLAPGVGGRPAWPLVVEALAQLAAVVAITGLRRERGLDGLPEAPEPGFLASIPALEVFPEALPQAGRPAVAVSLAVTVERLRGRLALVRGVAYAGAALVVRGRLVLGVGR